MKIPQMGGFWSCDRDRCEPWPGRGTQGWAWAGLQQWSLKRIIINDIIIVNERAQAAPTAGCSEVTEIHPTAQDFVLLFDWIVFSLDNSVGRMGIDWMWQKVVLIFVACTSNSVMKEVIVLFVSNTFGILSGTAEFS